MTKVEIKYNPFLVETEIKVDEKKISYESALYEKVEGKRIQEWIDQLLQQLPETQDDDEFDIKFIGTRLDAEDVADAITRLKAEKGRLKISLDDSEALDVTSESKITELRRLFEKAKKGPFGKTICSLDDRFNDSLNPDFEVNVTATMSSGKSTLINAMLGAELLPALNQATTATIARIIDDDDESASGFKARRENTAGKEINEFQQANETLLEEWNSDEKTSLIEIRGNIKTIKQSKNVRLVLVDTPGPNNSQDSRHAEITRNAIDNDTLSMVLYVMDGTHPRITDDESLLVQIKDRMSEGRRLIHDRFVFVLNKLDNYKSKEPIAEAVEKTKKYLNHLGILNPIIVPISAETAKLVRLKRHNTIHSDDIDYCNLLIKNFNKHSNLNMIQAADGFVGPVCISKLRSRLEQASSDGEKAELLSGVPMLEELLQQFLNKHALPMKIRSAVDSLDKMMRKADEVKALHDVYDQKREKLDACIEKIRQLEENKTLALQAKKFRDRVEKIDLVCSKEIDQAKKTIRKKVNEFIDSNKDKFGGDIAPSEAQEIFAAVEKKWKSFASEFVATLNKNVNNDFATRMNQWRNEYEKHAECVLGKVFPDVSIKPLNSLCKAAMKLPSVDDMIREATYEKEIGRKLSPHLKIRRFGIKWVLPGPIALKWTTEITDERVDMSAVFARLKGQCQRALKNALNELESQSEENFQRSKRIVLESLDKMDFKIKKVLKELKETMLDQQSVAKAVHDAEEKLTWHTDFITELKAVLSIK
jgi:GTPase SAR1 family protein